MEVVGVIGMSVKALRAAKTKEAAGRTAMINKGAGQGP